MQARVRWWGALLMVSACGPGLLPDVTVGAEAREVRTAVWRGSQARVVRGWERRVGVGLSWRGIAATQDGEDVVDAEAGRARRGRVVGFPCAIEAVCVWERAARERALIAIEGRRVR